MLGTLIATTCGIIIGSINGRLFMTTASPFKRARQLLVRLMLLGGTLCFLLHWYAINPILFIGPYLLSFWLHTIYRAQ